MLDRYFLRRLRRSAVDAIVVVFALVIAGEIGGCATEAHGRAIQRTAVGASLATTGALSLTGLGVGSVAILSQKGGPEILAASAVPLLVGAAVGATLLGSGVIIMTIESEDLALPPNYPAHQPTQPTQPALATQPIESSHSRVGVNAVYNSATDMTTASVAVDLQPHWPAPVGQLRLVAKGKSLKSGALSLSIDVEGATWRYKNCTPTLLVDGISMTPVALYGGTTTPAGVVERFVLTFDELSARAVANGKAVDVRICLDTFRMQPGDVENARLMLHQGS